MAGSARPFSLEEAVVPYLQVYRIFGKNYHVYLTLGLCGQLGSLIALYHMCNSSTCRLLLHYLLTPVTGLYILYIYLSFLLAVVS